MERSTLKWLGLVVVLGACADETLVGTDVPSATLAPATAAVAAPDLGTCTNLTLPADARLRARTYATGVQIHRWTGTAWAFDGPEADLYADAGFTGVVGDHFAGPTWRTNSGSTIVAALHDKCTPDANAIPWLWLDVKSESGHGLFNGIKYIHRLQTTGGLVPSGPGAFVGEVRRVPYTATYYFYTAK